MTVQAKQWKSGSTTVPPDWGIPQNHWGNQRTEEPKTKQHIASVVELNEVIRKALSSNTVAVFTARPPIIALGLSALS